MRILSALIPLWLLLSARPVVASDRPASRPPSEGAVFELLARKWETILKFDSFSSPGRPSPMGLDAKLVSVSNLSCQANALENDQVNYNCSFTIHYSVPHHSALRSYDQFACLSIYDGKWEECLIGVDSPRS